ncbi:hypothetical protein O181_131711 [Austropuccinia psidii MF-1]|uniref:Uncharacterized protein n=1 Tax=Austropuccinia psidii MF-1 TaxID=1389203 RepID=A0A9Q3QAK2_9BASI|nr:hypothetical protein [Austropuccinia psidii MF-1]
MPIQHPPPERQTRAQAVLAPLDGTPAVPPLRSQLDRGPCMEVAAPSRKEGRKRAKKIKLILRRSWQIPRIFKDQSQRSR